MERPRFQQFDRDTHREGREKRTPELKCWENQVFDQWLNCFDMLLPDAVFAAAGASGRFCNARGRYCHALGRFFNPHLRRLSQWKFSARLVPAGAVIA